VSIRVKRVYDPPSPGDGLRVLVDRLWPRGLTTDAAGVDVWVRDIAPSNKLRQWYGHDAVKWRDFQARYAAELADVPEAVATLRALVRQGRVTLLFGSREPKRNNAVALAAWLAQRRARSTRTATTRVRPSRPSRSKTGGKRRRG
jgi:uncharacterized protein YeaO (DUF488 family)